MKTIEKLSEYIDEEIYDAMKYAKCALAYKDENPMSTETFVQLTEMTIRCG